MSGETISLLAHGYSFDDKEFVFSLLMDGKPPVEIDAARVPQSIMQSVEGG